MKKILLIFLLFFVSGFVYAESTVKFVLKVELYKRNNFDMDENFPNKEKIQFLIEDSDGGEKEEKYGCIAVANNEKCQFNILFKNNGESRIFDYQEGKKIKFSVAGKSKNRWKIVSPNNGEVFLPKYENESIKLTLKPLYVLYSVQISSNENETSAARLKNNIIKSIDGYKICSVKFLPVYLEKYMAFNMPDNGFNHKVKVGEFENKKCAENLLSRLKKDFPVICSDNKNSKKCFITLKDYK